MSIQAPAVPSRMKGIRLPSRVFTRSLKLPKRGRRNSASTLSAAIMAPDQVSSSRKWLVRIRGTRLSYICQKAQMDKKANPTRTVVFLFNFMEPPLAFFIQIVKMV